MVGAAAQAEGTVVAAGDSALHGPRSGRPHDAADVGRAHLAQRLDRASGVVGGELGVCVDTHDNRVAAVRDCQIEASGDVAGGVGDERHTGILVRELLGNGVSGVGGRSECEHELLGSRVLLREHRMHGLREEALFVEHRHDVAHAGKLGQGREHKPLCGLGKSGPIHPLILPYTAGEAPV